MSTKTDASTGSGGVVSAILQSTLAQWSLILTLIFGGCCSNALALEHTASQNPRAGTLITFAQFLLVALAGLRSRLYVPPFRVSSREGLVDEIARTLLRERGEKGGRIVKVLIQGRGEGGGGMGEKRDGEGKKLAGDVAERLRTISPVSVIRASAEDFRKLGDDYDYAALRSGLLEPLSPEGSQKYVTKAYDSTGTPLPPPHVLPTAARRSILLLDAAEPLASELAPFWDFQIVLDGSYKPPKGGSCPTIVVEGAETKRPHIAWTNVVVPMPLLVKVMRLRFRPLKIPMSRWIVQVVLFLVTSLLNNAAFKYSIPMAVHIIFRSAGLVVNLLLGLAVGKKYTPTQIFSVLIVTAGVAMSTHSSLSHKRPKHHTSPSSPSDTFHTTSTPIPYQDYAIGLAFLTLALVLSSIMGLAQERTYAKFGRHWQEGMFYLHFLALPMFAFPGIGGDLMEQISIANASPKVEVGLHNFVGPARSFAATSPVFRPGGPLGAHPVGVLDWVLERVMAFPLLGITMPSFYVPLAINVFTQFLCVGGVHRLTSRVSSLTVTLVLVVRKAVSLWISVALVGGDKGDLWLWGGALAVVLGTVAYTLGSTKPKPASKGEKEL